MIKKLKTIILGIFMLGVSSTVVLGDLVEEKMTVRVASEVTQDIGNLAPFFGMAAVFVIVAVVIIIVLRKKN